MSADQLDFPDASFDWVLCGFALWFFPRPHHTLQEFFRVLKPGGRVGLTPWTEDCPFLEWVRQAISDSLPPQTPAPQRGAAPPSFDTPAKLETALQQAGFAGIEIDIEDHDFVYSDDEEWCYRCGPMGYDVCLSGLRRQNSKRCGPICSKRCRS